MSALGLAAGSVGSRAKAQMGGSTGSMLPCNEGRARGRAGLAAQRAVGVCLRNVTTAVQSYRSLRSKKHEKDACMHFVSLSRHGREVFEFDSTPRSTLVTRSDAVF